MVSMTLPFGRDVGLARRTDQHHRCVRRAGVEGFCNLIDVLRAYGEGNIFGEAYGDGPVQAVWLHGWRRSSADFAAAAGLLARDGVASVALDLPGFGASPLPESAGGAQLYAELVRGALEAMSGEPLILVGHSFGGRVATAIAASYPELVRALVLTGVPLVRRTHTRRSPRGFRLVRALHRRGVISEARMEAARQKYGSSDYRHASGLLRDILVVSVNESYEGELARVSAPVTLVWGENDHEVPVDVARQAAALLVASPAVELEVLADTGHLVPTERPAELVAQVQRLVAGP
jgi:pimeloyl-ACP methyl ester carboxylesterase